MPEQQIGKISSREAQIQVDSVFDRAEIPGMGTDHQADVAEYGRYSNRAWSAAGVKVNESIKRHECGTVPVSRIPSLMA